MKMFGYCAIVLGFLFLLMAGLIIAGGRHATYSLGAVSALLISQGVRLKRIAEKRQRAR
jgi:hypothetical protein